MAPLIGNTPLKWKEGLAWEGLYFKVTLILLSKHCGVTGLSYTGSCKRMGLS